MRNRLLCLVVAAIGFVAATGYGDVGDIIPAGQLTATASSSDGTIGYDDPMVVVNGSGMSGDTHVSNWGSWFTDGVELDRWIVVDLGSTYALGEVKVWNANEAWSWNMYGFKDTEVYVSNMAAPGNPVDNVENWTLVDTVTLTQALGELGVNSPVTDILDLTGNVATHVALRALNTYIGGWGTEAAGLSELRFFEGVPPVPGQAYGPVPEVDETGVELEVVLEWTIGDDPNNPGQPYADITRHFVWMSDGVTEDLALVDTIDAAEATVYAPPAELDRDAVYYWRVDEGIEDYPAGDPNNIIGKIWSFATELSVPTIDDAYPEDVFVDLGGEAELTVVATNPFTGGTNDLSYEWYKYVDGINDTPRGDDSPILTISDAQEIDEGEYYCVVTIGANSAWGQSRLARVTIKRLVGHWKLDETLDEESGTHNGAAYGEPNFVEGLVDPGSGSALDLYGSNDAVVIVHSTSLNENHFTAAAWAKVTGGSGTFRAVISARNDDPWSGYMIYASAPNIWEFWTGTGSGLDQLGAGAAGAVVEGEWVHLVASFEMTGATEESLLGTKRLYINGLLAAEQTDALFAPNEVTDVLIGAGANETQGYDFFFYGLIDDCRVYNYALDATEVGVLYSDVQGSYCVNKPALDYSDNCRVDLADLAIFAASWMECGLFPECVNTIE